MEQFHTAAGAETPSETTTDQVDVEVDDLLAPEQEDSAEQGNSAEMGELPVEDWDFKQPRRGEVRMGVILSIEDQEIIVDVGSKRDGIVPYADMQRMGEEALSELSVGDEVAVYVLRPEDRDGNLLVSLFMARQEKSWQQAQELADSGQAWEGEVEGFNKGGLVIPLGEIRGFVPASQVPGFPRGLGQEERLERLSTMVGETLLVKVIEINRRKRRLILSATSAQQQWRKQHRERLLDELREGEVRRGRVSSLASFGAFVDLGGADGLIHLSELSWRRVRHPKEVLNMGDEVEVFVLRLDRERKRIGLSLKRLQPEPWALVEDMYELGQLIEGVVTNVVDFGAFAEIEEGIEGLIHISELTDGTISHPREVVKKGDLLLLRIIRIDARRRRLGLSLKRVLESEWAEWAAKLAAEDRSQPADAERRPSPQPAVEEPVEEAGPEGLQPVAEAEEGEAEPPELELDLVQVGDTAEEQEPEETADLSGDEKDSIPVGPEESPAAEQVIEATEEVDLDGGDTPVEEMAIPEGLEGVAEVTEVLATEELEDVAKATEAVAADGPEDVAAATVPDGSEDVTEELEADLAEFGVEEDVAAEDAKMTMEKAL